jgi:hypothetical protein
MTRYFVLCAAAVALAASLSAQEKRKAAAPAGDDPMAAMARHAQTNEHHKVLAQLAGNWKFEGKMWMDPSADPMPFNGTSERKLIWEGKFLADSVKGEGFPFEGKGCVGYCNHAKKYQYVWIDSMTTTIANGEGTYDAKTKTFTMKGDSFDPSVGKVVTGKEVTVVKADGKVVSTFYKVLDGKDVKAMEITYTKQ